MSAVLVALLSGFLSSAQASQIALLCGAEEKGKDEIVVKCVLFVEGKPFRGVESQPLRVPHGGLRSEDLVQLWCSGATATLPQGGGAT